MKIDWKNTFGAVFRHKSQQLVSVSNLDHVSLESLVGIDEQKQELLENTRRFLEKQPCNHVLLWGSRGMGKSSLIKAIFHTLQPSDLRIVQVPKEDLDWLPEIMDSLRVEPYRFILFCDDLSFENEDSSYKGLKSILEGGIEAAPENMIVYATSNRRHLLPEYQKDNQAEITFEGEIHYGDVIEEKISLSDRFGLWISFYQGTQSAYLEMVDSYFKDYVGDRKQLRESAKLFAHGRGSRSGRTAKQFYQSYTKNRDS